MLDLSSVRRAVASTELVKQKTSDSGSAAGKDSSGSEESPDPENPPRSPTEVAAMQHHQAARLERERER